MSNFIESLNAIAWPDSLNVRVAELDDTLTELETALTAGDVDAARPLATAAHDQMHALEHAVTEPNEEGKHEHGEDYDTDHNAGEGEHDHGG